MIEALAADLLVGIKQISGIGELVGRVDSRCPAITHHPAASLGLAGDIGLDFRVFGHLGDHGRHLGAEVILDLLAGQSGVLDDIVEQRRGDDGLIESFLAQQLTTATG